MNSLHKIVEELMASNDPPSDAAIKEVKRRLDGPLQAIADIDAEILDLEKRLHELRIKRAEREAFVERYRAILTPIRRLPRDVLGEIFHRCLTTHRNPIMKATECPMLLTRVCSTWRATAMSEPRLWARVYITLSNDDRAADLRADVDTEVQMGSTSPIFSEYRHWQKLQRAPPHTLRLKCDAVKEWLSRSGELPLSVSIFFTANFNRGPDATPSRFRPESKATRDIVHEFLEVLAALSPRFEDLEFHMPIEIYRELEGMMDVSKMKKLATVRARYHSHAPGSQLGRINPVLLLRTPNLRKLSMCAHNSGLWGVLDPTYTRIWNKLTDISCHNPLSIDEISLLLGHSPNLVHFKAFMVQYASTDNSVTPILNDVHITLPFLLTLSMTDSCDPRNSERLYRCIDAPALKQVIYTSNFFRAFSTDNPPISILQLLRRSTGLKQLVIEGSTWTLWDIGTVLRDVPSVTHLVIGPEVRSQDGSLERTSSIIQPLHVASWRALNNPTLDLEGLVFTMPDNISIEYEHPLLPHLESFEFSSSAIRMKDENLLKFITSRINHPSSPSFSRIANLKHVAIVFHQRKQHNLDIAAEIQRHAELVGVDMIDLTLDYPKVPEKLEINPAAPDFGLVATNGRSWCHTDAGEYVGWM